MMMKTTTIMLATVLVLAFFASAAQAQVQTGAGGVCCAFLWATSTGRWQLACNNPTNVPGAQRFPAGTIISAARVVPGQIAQCVGRFPFPRPAPFFLPPNGVQLFATPNGMRCAGQFNTFYQGLGPDGGFVVQCTGTARSASTATARAQAVTAAEATADPALVFAPTDGYPVTAATGADALVPMAPNGPVNP